MSKHIQSFGKRWWWLHWKKQNKKYTNITTDQFLHLFYSCSSRSIFIYDKKNTFIFLLVYFIYLYININIKQYSQWQLNGYFMEKQRHTF